MKFIALIATVFLSGCAAELAKMKTDEDHRNNEQLQEQADELRNRERLQKSLLNNSDTVACPTKVICDKAFSLAKVFIQQHADMKIQFSDDTMSVVS